MRFFRSLLLLCSLFVAALAVSQNTRVDSLVDNAVAWREKGNGELALRELDLLAASKNVGERVLFELAFTHLQLGHYTLAITPAKKVMANNGQYRVDAALILMECYVARGEYNRARRLFKPLSREALVDERIPYHFAALYQKMGMLDEAEEQIQRAILINRSYVDAHLLLCNIMLEKGERLKAMLPLYYYLLLDNGGDEGDRAVKQLIHLWKFSSGRMLEMFKPSTPKGVYALAQRHINAIAVNDSIGKLDGGGAIDLLSRHTASLFDFLSTHNEDNFDFYQLVYIDFFCELHAKGHVEPFTYYICNPQWHPQVLEWIAGNGQRFNAFRIWMESR